MQEEIVQKDNALKKAAEDMKFYKLELINREESFNKMFGTNPNVGYINPLVQKPQTGKQTIVGAAGKGVGMGIGGMGMGLTGSTPANALNLKDGRKNSKLVQ